MRAIKRKPLHALQCFLADFLFPCSAIKEQGYSLHPVFQQQLQGAVTSRCGVAPPRESMLLTEAFLLQVCNL